MTTALGRAIKKHRRATGRTMRQAASDLGVTERTYARWEAGDGSPRPEHIERLESYFGVRLPEERR